jgi:hypothetical protein
MDRDRDKEQEKDSFLTFRDFLTGRDGHAGIMSRTKIHHRKQSGNNFPKSKNILQCLRNTRVNSFSFWPGHVNECTKFMASLICITFPLLDLMEFQPHFFSANAHSIQIRLDISLILHQNKTVFVLF